VEGELDRTTGQLRLFGYYVAAGRHLPARVSPGAGPGGADIRQIVVPVGPVAVFAASNFPLAFGVLGGDTASALAAGCPVIVKAHPAQPVLSRLLAELVAPVFAPWPGAFAVIHGGPSVSIALAKADGIKAIGFTGSLAGGRALLDAAATRAEPIPVFAEMGSINPVFVLPGAAADMSRAQTLAASVTGSSGQLCTKPGLVLVPETPEGQEFAAALAAAVAAGAPHRMLTERMAGEHASWVRAAEAASSVRVRVGADVPAALAITVAARDLPVAMGGELLSEHFGPSVVIALASVDEMPVVAGGLEGQLTATVHATEDDMEHARALLPMLAAKAGRIVWNGVPTGVAVVDAMLHGGPWPATSAPWSTSVGTAAIERFQRPVALQGVPPGLLD
jgi:acyl-CoA reductase-like NAD-dependent aldehyde dehydrogenase